MTDETCQKCGHPRRWTDNALASAPLWHCSDCGADVIVPQPWEPDKRDTGLTRAGHLQESTKEPCERCGAMSSIHLTLCVDCLALLPRAPAPEEP